MTRLKSNLKCVPGFVCGRQAYKKNEYRHESARTYNDIRTMGLEAPCGSRHKHTSKYVLTVWLFKTSIQPVIVAIILMYTL